MKAIVAQTALGLLRLKSAGSVRRRIRTVKQAGVALVIVLAFVVLLTGLIVAYFSRSMADRQLSNSSLNQTKADELARSALDIITGGLKQEIVLGSGTMPDPTGSGPTIYRPSSNSYMVPQRNTPTNPTSTLIRISSTSATTVSGTMVDFAASNNALSTGTSANGRSVTLARWNQHYLLPLNPNNTSPTDTTPATSFTAPSWVYVTGTGGPANPPLTAPNSAVIGRYAYAVYDEGALLDANVAGYPSQLPYLSGSSMPSQFTPKGSLAFADLTQLTGTSGNPLITGTGINNLVGWRNYASMQNAVSQPSGAYPNFTFTGTTTMPTAYKNLITSNKNGFIKVSGSTASSGLTDQAFLTRQQLIALCLASGTANFNPQALQYLGTFSRAVNAPSWSPTSDAGNGYLYKSNAESATMTISGSSVPNPNRDIPNVRFQNAGIVTHYSDDGTTATYAVNAGDPLVQRRFSLAKLAWLRYDGPNPAAFNSSLSAQQQKDAIQACFGLKWQGSTLPAPLSNARWEYVGATGGTTQHSIKTLDQVVQEPQAREPNFFELLKAGILSGAVGQDPGPSNQANNATDLVQGVQGDVYNYKMEADLHILQIGANIIDQADADSYPTAIHLNPFGLTGADDLSLQTVYGVENLPYLTGIRAVTIADPPPPVKGASGTLKFWLQPQLWNPHQVPTSTLSGFPTEFRAYAYGSIMGAWYTASDKTFRLCIPANYDDGSGSGSNLAEGSIYFTDTGNSASSYYNNPQLLTVALVDKTLTPAQNLYNPGNPNYTNLKADQPPIWSYGVNEFAGFSGSYDPNFNPDPTPNPDDAHTQDVVSKLMFPNPFTYFSLQYKGPDGGYHPYNFMARIAKNGGNPYFKQIKTSPDTVYTIPGATHPAGYGPIRPDPRTDRFSAGLAWWEMDGLYETSMNPLAVTNKILPYRTNWPNNSHFIWNTPTNPLSPQKFFFASLLSINDESYPPVMGNSGGTLVSGIAYYSDPDGVVRYGDGYRGNTQGVQGKPLPATGDGCQLLSGDATVSPASTLSNPQTIANPPGSAEARRPVILNRPFRSVGELGFAYRDLPFRTLDFWSPRSGDAALLDLFSISDQPTVAAGQIGINSASAPILRAILSGGAKNDALSVQINGADVQILADKIAADISTNGPYGNRASLATRLGPLVSDPYTSGKAFDTTQSATANWANKAYAEMPMRALVDVVDARTWNLMIDVIAQTGMFVPNAPQTAAALNTSFVVQGERRYWLHVAIDRFTGKIIDEQFETVYE